MLCLFYFVNNVSYRNVNYSLNDIWSEGNLLHVQLVCYMFGCAEGIKQYLMSDVSF